MPPRSLKLPTGYEIAISRSERLLAALRARPEVELHYEPRPKLSHATIYHPTAWEALQALYPRPEE